MYDSMQIFILCRTVSFPLNLLGHETFNESSLKVGSGETKQNVLIQSCDVTGGSLNTPELCVCHHSHNLQYSFPNQMDTLTDITWTF